jgi:Transport and Golgi organisation 2
MLRLDPGAPWPLLLTAVRDEFVDRAWDPPAPHWPDLAPGVVGGRDRVAGGTWLAVRPDRPAVAALLNGVRLALPSNGVRPSRGGLPLAVLTERARLNAADLAGYDGFHLILGTPTAVTVWSWNGQRVRRSELAKGNHIIVNEGVDTGTDPLVPHFQPLLERLPSPLPPEASWQPWLDLLRGDGLAGDDPRALIKRRQVADRTYGSSSASVVGLPADGNVRFAFTATPASPSWYEVPVAT